MYAAAIWRARFVAFIFAIVSVSLFLLMVKANKKVPASLAIVDEFQTAWARAIGYDFYAGTLFVIVYLWVLNGPSLLFVPSRVLGFLIPLVSNSFVLLYIACWLFFTDESTVSVLLPFSSASSASYLRLNQQQQNGNAYNKTTIRIVMAMFIFMLAVVVSSIVFALSQQPAATGWESISDWEQPWRMVTFVDTRAGLLLTLTVVLAREQSFVVAQLLWTFTLITFGNIATCVYVIMVATQAIRNEIGFARCLLTPRRLLPGSGRDGVDEQEGLLARVRNGDQFVGNENMA